MSKRTHQPAEAPQTRGRTIRFLARFYDAGSWLLSFGQEAKTNREIIEIAGIQPGEKVLDIGCGTGAQTLPAAERAGPGNVAGIDASPEMLEVARRKAAKRKLDIDFRLTPAEDLPFGDGEFDVVLSSFMLHHLPEDVIRAAFQEVHRVLKPDGRFLAVDMASRGLIGAAIRLFGHAHTSGGVEKLKQMLNDAGFRSVEELPRGKNSYLVFIRSLK